MTTPDAATREAREIVAGFEDTALDRGSHFVNWRRLEGAIAAALRTRDAEIARLNDARQVHDNCVDYWKGEAEREREARVAAEANVLSGTAAIRRQIELTESLARRIDVCDPFR